MGGASTAIRALRWIISAWAVLFRLPYQYRQGYWPALAALALPLLPEQYKKHGLWLGLILIPYSVVAASRRIARTFFSGGSYFAQGDYRSYC